MGVHLLTRHLLIEVICVIILYGLCSSLIVGYYYVFNKQTPSSSLYILQSIVGKIT